MIVVLAQYGVLGSVNEGVYMLLLYTRFRQMILCFSVNYVTKGYCLAR